MSKNPTASNLTVTRDDKNNLTVRQTSDNYLCALVSTAPKIHNCLRIGNPDRISNKIILSAINEFLEKEGKL